MVLICGGCQRLISVSQIPGGNPSAKANPDRWAVAYARCDCGHLACDRCISAANGKCPNCGRRVRVTQGHP